MLHLKGSLLTVSSAASTGQGVVVVPCALRTRDESEPPADRIAGEFEGFDIAVRASRREHFADVSIASVALVYIIESHAGIRSSSCSRSQRVQGVG